LKTKPSGPIDVDAIHALVPRMAEVLAFLDAAEEQMAAFAVRMRCLAHWEAELAEREAEVAAREAALRPVTTGNGPSQ
jgi:hypothetical protein